MALLPITQSASTFSIDIYANGKRIGNCQSFTPTTSRTHTRVREIGSARGGETSEIVPSISDHSITLSRVELYREETIEALGYSVDSYASLEDLRTPIDIRQVMTKPDGTKIVTEFQECWCSNATQNGISSSGNVITDSITLQVTRIRRGKG